MQVIDKAASPIRSDEYLSSPDVAALFQISIRTVVNLRQRRVLPFIRLGRLVRYRRGEIESALRSYAVVGHPIAEQPTRKFVYTGTMRKRSKDWPNIRLRRYASGREKWIVDLGRHAGKKRDRRFFDTQKE